MGRHTGLPLQGAENETINAEKRRGEPMCSPFIVHFMQAKVMFKRKTGTISETVKARKYFGVSEDLFEVR